MVGFVVFYFVFSSSMFSYLLIFLFQFCDIE